MRASDKTPVALADSPGGKQFAKDTVYKAHLTGKKHKKAAEKLKESGQAATIDIATEKKKYEEQERAKQKEVAKLVCVGRVRTRMKCGTLGASCAHGPCGCTWWMCCS